MTKRRSILALLATALLLSTALADRPRRRRAAWYPPPATVEQVAPATPLPAGPAAKEMTTYPGLGEVNAARAQRGLPAFQADPLLQQAAEEAARRRAAIQCHGHLPGPQGDFACIPPGGQAAAAGCGALTPDWGWGSCCAYDGYTYAGAAWVQGSDGRRYMHLFVR